ncbi:MAG: hypothetical protein CMK59_00330 [Proteobacteria bacterium]|nr:hypothetical protein [Pseudomonadota bacterium]
MSHIIVNTFHIPVQATVELIWEGPNNRWNSHAETAEEYVEKFHEIISQSADIIFLSGGLTEYTGNVWDFVDSEYPISAKVQGNWDSVENFLSQSSPRILEEISLIRFSFKGTTLTTHTTDINLNGLVWGRKNDFFETNRSDKVQERQQLLQKQAEEIAKKEQMEKERLEEIRKAKLANCTIIINRTWSNFISAGENDIELTAEEFVSLLDSLWSICDENGCIVSTDESFVYFKHQEGGHTPEASPDLCWIFDSGHFAPKIESLKNLPSEFEQNLSVQRLREYLS